MSIVRLISSSICLVGLAHPTFVSARIAQISPLPSAAQFDWPTGWMVATLLLAATAIVVPLRVPPGRFKWQSAIALCLAASISWLVYEGRIQALARPGDPLIRVDLFVLIPLTAAAWLSAFVLLFRKIRREGDRPDLSR